MCTHSVKLFKEKKKKKERTRKIYRTSERATRPVWRIRSDVAFQCYVLSSKEDALLLLTPTGFWLITLAATKHLSGLSLRAFIWVSGYPWLILCIFRPSKISRPMSTSRPRIDSLRSSSTIDHSAWEARAPSPSVSPLFGDDTSTDRTHHSQAVLDHNNGLKSQSTGEPCANHTKRSEAIHRMF